jgi:heme A synthase
MIDIALYLTYILVLAAIILVLVFAVTFLVKNFRKSKTTLFGALGLFGVFIISYLISSSEVYEKYQIGAGLSKVIGGALISLYIIFAFTILIAIYGEISKFFK